MDPISLILTALVAGLAQGAGQAAATAVRDAYTGLRSALARRLSGRRAAQDALEQYVADPEAWRGNLRFTSSRRARTGTGPSSTRRPR